jgi:hypothetical protein
MTRGELVAELLGLWEEKARLLETDGFDRAAGEVRAAISVLEKTYSGQELIANDQSYCESQD